MTLQFSPTALSSLLQGSSVFALIDIREAGEYNTAHIPGASLIPRRELEFRMEESVPFKGTPVILCDDNGRRSPLAAATVEKMGYTHVSILEGGANAWVTQDFPTEWGMNVPSKDFGERVQIEHHVTEISASELHERMERGDKLVILDTRTPEEYNRYCIPGGRSMPGGEIAFRIGEIIKDVTPETTVVVNCAGRTRSIIGTRMLQRMGLKNVCGLQNGTSGWMLAGYDLEAGADRLKLPEPSPETIAQAEEIATAFAEQDGVEFISVPELQQMMDRRKHESIYLVDVRTREEYERGHIPGFRWFPGGQAVQRSDEVMVAHNSSIVFSCDGRARAAFTASWYRQMGHRQVYVLDGGTTAWQSSRRALEKGMARPEPFGLAAASARVAKVAPEQAASVSATSIHVGTSQEFANGHVPGARWLSRSWLEIEIGSIAPDRSAPVLLTCLDGANSILAAATLLNMGYEKVTALQGGMRAWNAAGLPVEQGLTGVMSPPNDIVPSGPDRSFADMMNYLRWEEALGHKYETH